MRQFEIHMPETTAKKLRDRLNGHGQRDCGHGMVIVEFDELSRAEEGLGLAKSDAKLLTEINPVRGM